MSTPEPCPYPPTLSRPSRSISHVCLLGTTRSQSCSTDGALSQEQGSRYVYTGSLSLFLNSLEALTEHLSRLPTRNDGSLPGLAWRGAPSCQHLSNRSRYVKTGSLGLIPQLYEVSLS